MAGKYGSPCKEYLYDGVEIQRHIRYCKNAKASMICGHWKHGCKMYFLSEYSFGNLSQDSKVFRIRRMVSLKKIKNYISEKYWNSRDITFISIYCILIDILSIYLIYNLQNCFVHITDDYVVHHNFLASDQISDEHFFSFRGFYRHIFFLKREPFIFEQTNARHLSIMQQ